MRHTYAERPKNPTTVTIRSSKRWTTRSKTREKVEKAVKRKIPILYYLLKKTAVINFFWTLIIDICFLP